VDRQTNRDAQPDSSLLGEAVGTQGVGCGDRELTPCLTKITNSPCPPKIHPRGQRPPRVRRLLEENVTVELCKTG
jgi:hypothetical protein